MNSGLDQKRQMLLDRYKDLFIQKTGFNGANLDNYVNNLIGIGEKYYGSNFVEDILREKRDDSIVWLIDEVSKHSWMDSHNLINADSSKGLPAGNKSVENLENALNSSATLGLPEGNDNSAIYDSISKMNEYELEDYLRKVITSENSNKFYGIVSNLKKSNPDLSDFEAFKKALVESGITLINPNITAGGQTANTINENLQSSNNFEVSSVSSQEPEVLEPVKDDVFTSVTDFRNLNVTEPTTNLDSTIPMPEPIKDASIPSTAKVGKRKAASNSLISKFKEKWKDPKFKKKLLIGAIAIGVIGIGVMAATAISQIISNQTLDTNSIINANHLTSSLIDGLNLDSISDTMNNSAVSGNEYMDYTVNAGDTIYSNAADAINGQNGVFANEYFTDNPQGIYDTANNTWVDTTNVDFNNVDDMRQFMDGNHALVEGGNGDLDGFIPIDDSMIKNK